MDGVKELMSFIQGKFNENVEILSPCVAVSMLLSILLICMNMLAS